MTVLLGRIADSPNAFGFNPYLAVDGRVVAKVQAPFGIVADGRKSLWGTRTYSPDITVPAQHSLDGIKAQSFYDDYYNRIHIAPSTIALGDVVSSQVRTVEVWNAYLSPKLLSGIGSSGADGLTLAVPAPLPTAFAPTQSRIYSVSVSLNGPAEIDAEYDFMFSSESVALKVTGRRVVLFPWKPNFNTALRETLEWKTDVLRSFDGIEQRRTLRSKARRSFEFTINVTNSEAQYWQSVMWGWQSRLFALPVWVDKRPLRAAANSGVNVLNIDTVGYGFVVGGLVGIYNTERDNEIVEVKSITANSVELARPLTGNWPIGSAVMPMILGHLPTSVNVTRHTNTVLTMQCSFTSSADVTDPFVPSAPAVTTYDGYEVITAKPNWANGLTMDYQYEFKTIDFGIGQTRWLGSEKDPFVTRAYSWLLTDRLGIQAFRSFLGRQRGRAKACWVPSWTDDFTMVLDLLVNTTSMTVKENLFSRQVGVNASHDRIMIRTTDGRVFYRRIVATGLAGDQINAIIEIDTPINTTLAVSDIQSIHILNLCRFATDKFDFQWHTDDTVTVDSNFMTVSK